MLPKQRQTLFFSATMPKAIKELPSQYLTDPAQVAVAPQATTAERVEQ
jgi:ATP-dependent RNA helicase RhlE